MTINLPKEVLPFSKKENHLWKRSSPYSKRVIWKLVGETNLLLWNTKPNLIPKITPLNSNLVLEKTEPYSILVLEFTKMIFVF